jgi:uncharacterized protein (DUF433 family)
MSQHPQWFDDPRDTAMYTMGDAARYLHIPYATVRSWVMGRTYQRQEGVARFEPLIRRSGSKSEQLSFYDLVEVHVLRALRTRHGVPIRHVRDALEFAENQFTIERLLLRPELETAGGDLFIERFGQLINLSKSGQLAIRALIAAHLKRVERDPEELPMRLYPFLTGELVNGVKTVVIDPRVSYGRPTVVGRGVSTEVIAARIDAGESVEMLSADYDLDRQQIEEVVVYEKAA